MRTTTAVIPARGGSEGIKRKNLQEIAGKSLVERSVTACLDAKQISRVVVSTDDADIGTAAIEAGADVIWRPLELAGSTATSESALEHAIQELDFVGDAGEHGILLVQCTSPFTTSGTLNDLVQKLSDYDSVFTGVRSHAFVWRQSQARVMESVNHNHMQRLRRQDLQPDFIESGNAYAMRLEGFKLARHRFFGRIGVQEIDPSEWHEIDSEQDLEFARYRADFDSQLRLQARKDLTNIKAVVLDFDGVLTDNRAFLSETGAEYVAVNRGDGHGIQRILENGFKVLILTSDTSLIPLQRARKLKVEIIAACDNKSEALEEWAKSSNLDLKNVAYVGNDIMDIAPMKLCGLSSCPRDAHRSVRQIADYVIPEVGGHGAVRKFCDLLLDKRNERHS